MDFIQAIESKLGVEAQKQMLPMQPGDVNQTWADVRALQNDYNYTPNTSVEGRCCCFCRVVPVLLQDQ
jgi:UDP-glucuronate 4-epimerase